MDVEVNTRSGLYSKHLLERTGLIRYIGKTKTKIEITYDPETEEGFINVTQFMPVGRFRLGDWHSDREQQLLEKQDKLLEDYLKKSSDDF